MISKSTIMMIDSHALSTEYSRIADENEKILARARKIDAKIKMIERENGHMAQVICEQGDRIAGMMYVLDVYRKRVAEIDPEFILPDHVARFIS